MNKSLIPLTTWPLRDWTQRKVREDYLYQVELQRILHQWTFSSQLLPLFWCLIILLISSEVGASCNAFYRAHFLLTDNRKIYSPLYIFSAIKSLHGSQTYG